MKNFILSTLSQQQLNLIQILLLGLAVWYLVAKLFKKLNPVEEDEDYLKSVDRDINPTTNKLVALGEINKISPKDKIHPDQLEQMKVNQDPIVARDALNDGVICKYPTYRTLDSNRVLIEYDQRVQKKEILSHKDNVITALVELGVIGLKEEDLSSVYFDRETTDFKWIVEKPRPNPFLNPKFVTDHWDEFAAQFSKYRDYDTYSVPVGVPVSPRTKVHPSVAPIDNMMKLNTTMSPMWGVYGKTRSGKTAWIRTFLCILKLTYPDTQFIIVDGKIGGQDFSDYNKYWGLFKDVAQISTGENELINFDNAIFKTNEIWRERVNLIDKFKKTTGRACSTFAVYNKQRKLALAEMLESGRSQEDVLSFEKQFPQIPMLVVVIDEVPEIISAASPKPWDALNRQADSSWKLISSLMKVSGSFGIRMLFASQENVQPFFPAFIKKGITTSFYFKFPDDSVVTEYLGIKTGVLTNGRFYLCADGVTDESTGLPPVCQLPYSGDIPSYFTKLPAYEGERLEFKEDLISSIPEKMTDYDMIRTARVIWFKREGMNPTELKFELYWNFKFNFKGIDRRFIIADKKDLSEISYEGMNAFFPNRYQEKAILLITGAGVGEEVKLAEAAAEQGYIAIFSNNALRMLEHAFRLNNNLSDEKVITPWLEKSSQDKAITVIESNEDPSEDLELTKESLDYVVGIKGDSKGNKLLKGDLFEQWVIMLLKALGYYAYPMKDVLASEAYKHFNIKQGDLGGDILYSKSEIVFSNYKDQAGKIIPVVKSESEVILAQLKNWVMDIDQDVITRTTTAGKYFQASKICIMKAKGGVKKGANMRAELDLSGVEIVSYQDLVNMIPKQTKPQNQSKSDLELVSELLEQGKKQQQIADVLQFSIGKVNKLVKQIKENKAC